MNKVQTPLLQEQLRSLIRQYGFYSVMSSLAGLIVQTKDRAANEGLFALERKIDKEFDGRYSTVSTEWGEIDALIEMFERRANITLI